MLKPIRALIFPCGAENALELHAALSYAVNVELWGASSRDDHGSHVFRNYIGGVPFITDARFLEAFNRMLREREIDVVFPTHDTVAQYFAEYREKIAARVVIADAETARVCREKKRIHEVFAGCDFAPLTFSGVEAVARFPVFLKPNIGQGGQGTRLIRDAEEGAQAMREQSEALLVEYLPGAEYTVDCFTDRHGELRFVGPRERSRVFYGISVRSRSVPLTPEVRGIAAEINQRLRFRGLWYFQIKQATDGRLKLLEVSVRIAGTMCLYRHQGVNLPLLSVYDAMDLDVEIRPNDFALEVDRALFSRFRLDLHYETIYLDFDDTVICRGEVNPFVLLLLYQAARQGKPVHLLTRHEGDINQALAAARIHPGLFASIRTLGAGQEKHEFIRRGEKAVFIDNAYAERKKVMENSAIPVFDVDAVPALLDWHW